MMAFAPQDIDYTKLPEAPVLDADDAQANLNHETKVVLVTVHGKTLKIHTEQVTNKNRGSSLEVLFLHGMRFSSKNWLDIKSVFHVAQWGHRAVAVDLPGYGKSINVLLPELSGEFLKELISSLGMKKPVIVSPSMSGMFSLPYLFEGDNDSTDRASGYVPVAPIKTSDFVEPFQKSQLATLVVCGTEDSILGQVSTTDLMHLPKAKYAPIQGAGHPCYLDNPDAFHKLLYDFLKQM